MPDAIATLRQAAEVVRAQIPSGSLTLASVKTLLEAAERVCQETNLPPSRKSSSARQAKRQEARLRWAKIAQENAR